MADTVEQRLSGRTPTSNKYPYQSEAKLEVYAKPTDPMVNQGAEDSDTIKALAQINPAIEAYGKLQENLKAGNILQAQYDYATSNGTKPDKPNNFLNLGAGYDEAWNQIKGQKHAADDYQPAVNQYLLNNSQLPPEEFSAGLKTLKQGFLSKLEDPHTAAGFIPEADSYDKLAIKANQAKWMDAKETERNADINSHMRLSIEGAVQSTLGVPTLDQLSDPTFYKQFQKDKDNALNPGGVTKAEALGSKLYQLYRNGLPGAQKLGLNTATYSKMFLDTTIGVAVRTGMPSLLKYAFHSYTPTPEEAAAGAKPDNITVSDAYRKEVETGITEATVVQDKMLRTIKEQDKQDLEKKQRTVIRNVNDQLFDLMHSDDPQRYQKSLQLQAQFRKDAADLDIHQEDAKYVNTVVDAIDKRGMFADHNDYKTEMTLTAKGPALTHSDVIAAAHQLDQATYLRLLDRAWNYEKVRMDKDSQRELYAEHKAQELVLQGAEDLYTVRNPLTGITDPNADDAKAKAKIAIGNWMSRHKSFDTKSLDEFVHGPLQKQVAVPVNPYKSMGVSTTPVATGSGMPAAMPVGTSFADPIDHSKENIKVAPAVPHGAKQAAAPKGKGREVVLKSGLKVIVHD